MDLVDFLSAVVPPGRIIVARMVERAKPDGTKYKTFAHIVCRTHAEAAASRPIRDTLNDKCFPPSGF